MLQAKKILQMDKNRWVQILVVSLFFLVYLAIGFMVYDDYGISTDESIDFERGEIDYVRFRGGELSSFEENCSHYTTLCYYPPLFSMILFRAAPEGDWRDILLTRHLVTYLYFAFAVFVFYLTGTKIFKNWKIGLLGALFLILSPRIFANSFFNPKDIPFLSAYIIAIYTMLLFIEKQKWYLAIIHGIATGMACSIRTPGMILIPITGAFYLIQLFLTHKFDKKNLIRFILLCILFAVAAALFIYSFFPILYNNPVGNFIESFKIMKQFPWANYHLYMGQDIGNEIPWHYSIVWFSIGSPLFYVFLFLIGSIAILIRTFRSRSKADFLTHVPIYLVGACSVLPVLSVIATKSIIYTDNRQMYFCYPALLLISVYGLAALLGFLKQKIAHWQFAAALIILAGLAYPVYFTIRYHPHQNVYFNILAGSSMSVIKERFGLDGWALSTRQGLEYLLEHNPDGVIRVSSFEGRDFYYLDFKTLTPEQRERFVVDDENPRYIITTYRYYPEKQVETGEEYYSIMVGDAPIMTIYKVGP